MPKKLMDFLNTVIYKIVCNDLEVKDLYIGSTTNFTKRKYRHKSDSINEKSKNYNLKIYKTIRDNGGWNNWSMIEIEKYPCNDVNEAHARERYWYENLNANLNKLVPNRSKQEFNKIYHENNKEKHNLCSKQLYENNKEHFKELSKKYRDNHKEYYKQYFKEYRQKNKYILKEKTKQKCIQEYVCQICGKHLQHGNKSHHNKTKKHLIALAKTQLDITNL